MAKETQLSKKQEEIAKWFIDLAKYVATAIIISPIFGSFENKWMMVVFGVVLVLALMFVGTTILDKQTKQTTKKRK